MKKTFQGFVHGMHNRSRLIYPSCSCDLNITYIYLRPVGIVKQIQLKLQSSQQSKRSKRDIYTRYFCRATYCYNTMQFSLARFRKDFCARWWKNWERIPYYNISYTCRFRSQEKYCRLGFFIKVNKLTVFVLPTKNKGSKCFDNIK